MREHFRQTETTTAQLKHDVLAQFTFSSWKRFVEKNLNAYPRYVRDQCLLALKHFDMDTDEAVLEEEQKPVTQLPIDRSKTSIHVAERDVGEYASLLEDGGHS